MSCYNAKSANGRSGDLGLVQSLPLRMNVTIGKLLTLFICEIKGLDWWVCKDLCSLPECEQLGTRNGNKQKPEFCNVIYNSFRRLYICLQWKSFLICLQHSSCCPLDFYSHRKRNNTCLHFKEYIFIGTLEQRHPAWFFFLFIPLPSVCSHLSAVHPFIPGAKVFPEEHSPIILQESLGSFYTNTY